MLLELDGPASDMRALRAWRSTSPELCALWDESVPVSEWAGVVIGVDGADVGRVLELSLPLKKLTGIVPAEIGRLTALRTLYLNQNQLTSVPPELGRLTKLTSLVLFFNQLTSVPAELGNLTALQILTLSSNQLTSIPAELGNLAALQTLDLSNNQLRSIPAEFGQLTNLTSFRLVNNRVSSLPAELGALTSLLGLEFSGNPLSFGALPDEVKSLSTENGGNTTFKTNMSYLPGILYYLLFW
jgi:leucine-rich repeat protein SHOC2